MIAETTGRDRAQALVTQIGAMTSGPTTLMEVCGTHTMAIGRAGLRSVVPRDLRLLSGPGCPVCVTPCAQIDRMIAMAGEPGVTVATFGDMMRVPGSTSCLDIERSSGRDVRIVYSATEALDIAVNEPERLVVFFGIGFETTSPTVAATLRQARQEGTSNFLVLPAFKLVPPAMDALVEDGQTRIDGFICPGHVSTIIGASPYGRIASARSIPCVITGFEPLDILEAMALLLEQRAGGRAEVEVQYSRAVPRAGNRVALDLMAEVFRPCDATWRGIGVIPGSGLDLAPDFSGFDARVRVPVEVEDAPDLPDGCECGDVMRGIIVPHECPLFGRTCTPVSPVGPCMISSEGPCAAHHRFAGREA